MNRHTCQRILDEGGDMTRLNPQRANLVTLGVDDLARSREFYQALGWQPAENPFWPLDEEGYLDH